ncbi:MAG: hypothetical protein C4518_08610 [Desulfobacteraceae bacterium]|nr:MAG: hypothetical protein C4518_08610 [Desulfobacteraceae bacterium]
MAEMTEKEAIQAMAERSALLEKIPERKKIENSTDTTSNLLKCPDCGKDVSRRAAACLHCGCPIEAVLADQEQAETNITPKLCQTCGQPTNVNWGPSLDFVVCENCMKPPKADKSIETGPKCPHCESKSHHKISFKNKVGAGLLFGPFAIVHAGKTFKCDKCGFKW